MTAKGSRRHQKIRPSRDQRLGGTMRMITRMGGWHLTLGETNMVSEIVGMSVTGHGALRRGHGGR